MKKIKNKRQRSDVGGLLSDVFIVHKVRGRLQLISQPKPKRRKATPKQEAMRTRFRSAMQYAEKVAADPEAAALYAQRITFRHRTIRMVAVRDYMNPPEIKSATLFNDDLLIEAVDDFMVVEVHVELRDGHGRPVESGDAVLHPLRIHDWNYRISEKTAGLSVLEACITAKDRPGNEAKLVVKIK